VLFGIDEHRIDDGELLEIVSHSKCFIYAHAAVKLYGILSDKPRCLLR